MILIRAGGLEFEEGSNYLFSSYLGFIPKVKSKLHLSESSMKDAYSDALIKLIRHIKQGTFRQESKMSSYFYRILYNTSVDVLRKETTNKNMATTELHEYSAVERDLLGILEANSEAEQVLLMIDKMGETCKKILIDWGYYGYKMEEVAERADLANAKSATSMKYKCLQKLRAMLSN